MPHSTVVRRLILSKNSIGLYLLSVVPLRPFPYADDLRTVDTSGMAELPSDRAVTRPTALRSLSSKFSFFSAALVFWVVVTILAYDLRQDSFDWGKGLLLCVIVFLVADAIASFTTRLLARPARSLP